MPLKVSKKIALVTGATVTSGWLFQRSFRVMNRPAINLFPSILEVLGGFLALMAFLASDPDAPPAPPRLRA